MNDLPCPYLLLRIADMYCKILPHKYLEILFSEKEAING